VCFKFPIAAAFFILYLFTKFNITPRKSEQNVKFIFKQMFLKKNKVKVKYLFNVFLQWCLKNLFCLSIFNIIAQKQGKSDIFCKWPMTTRSIFLHDIFQQLNTVLFEDRRKMCFFHCFDANALRQVFVIVILL